MFLSRDRALGLRLIGGGVSWDPASSDRPRVQVDHAGETHAARVGDLHIVADVDLTNERELRDWTECRGDMSQLVAAMYTKAGSGFVSRLRGAFALAVWDERNRQLVLAVDHFGIKRLYYTSRPRLIAFASRASAVPRLAGETPTATAATVYSYLNFGFVPAAAMTFDGVHRLAPGHVLSARDGRVTSEPYWDMAYPERRMNSRQAALDLFRHAETAVARTVGDVSSGQAGAFLSGGTDSSTVVGLMARTARRPVDAFSIGFQENAYDELEYARIAARHFGAVHHTMVVTPEDAFKLLPRLVEALDEPFGNNSAIGTYFCVALARERGIDVLLAGDGGDEIFGGNERYRTDRIFGLYGRVPRALRRGLIEPLIFALPDGGESVLGRGQRYIRRANIPNPRRFFSYEFFFALEADRLFTADYLRGLDRDAPNQTVQALYDRVQASSELNRLLYLDLKLAIGDNDLLKVTRTAELAGVKVRFPMLDLDLAAFTGSLPATLKVRGLEKRHLFKRAMRDFLPPEILAKHKHGFGVPTSAWLRDRAQFQELVQDTLLSTRAATRGYFRPGVLAELLDWHRKELTPYYGDLLWRILMLELWHRTHLDGGAA